MRRLWTIPAALAALWLAAAPALALTLDDVQGPKEYPPASYKGTQFVDSTGCVFVRAGYAGQVKWIPRVTRDRQVICGQKPTFATPGEASTAATAPVAAKPAARTVSATPKPATPKPATTKPATAKPAAKAPASAPAEMTVVAEEVLPKGHAACPNRSDVAQRFMLSDGRYAIRCYPQKEYPKTYLTPEEVEKLPPGALDPRPVVVPPGYRPAWKDGRLNPKRGVGTAQGAAQMAAVWTRDVPMQLVADKRPAVTGATAPVATASSKSPAAQGRYIQIGSFAQPANVDAAAARLRAAGLPVARGRKQGQGALTVVLAGPFAPGEAAAALSTVRRAGFADAFLR